MKLNSRQRDILRATVRHYVNTAEPVGSKSLAKGYDLQVSSATIRNVMSALEGSGLLYQPHTSAGRIPSDSGYRRYVDELMVPSEPLTRRMETTLSDRLDWNGLAMEALLKESAQVLSRLSGYIALVTLPHVGTSVVKHLKLVRVSDHQILLVVLDIYDNHSVLLPIAPDPKDSELKDEHLDIDAELQVLSNFLTNQLRGRSLHDAKLDWSDLDQTFQRYTEALQSAIADLAKKTSTAPNSQILISGLAEALDQPEFAEREQIRSIVQLLEDGRDQLWPLIANPLLPDTETGSPLAKRQRIRIWIGAENPLEPMRACALIASRYGHSPGPTGSLGVLGPTRMLYENAVAAVEAAANYLTDAVSGSQIEGVGVS
ncbi:heat-inducible transcriptional repressor HrcA [cf. Phormidesmis sp. LEGE 11477]|uniref:heat-inducible transcriptional repressor HrcA n=1 Tax=cf. Phormidesmis sp. LEGE 11477 TaxID=1828680 RepID=UPI00187EDA9D|nr:heat-inducible transcriptional repressor HrcA [cf. Phormidesmis sp. LEGE 11477]MBE9063062.1 heat-inducible transcriptional repressor HrcA [cf. Phormidesmis sp. LEGE 11477]